MTEIIFHAGMEIHDEDETIVQLVICEEHLSC